MRGRKPKPTVLANLHGRPSKDKPPPREPIPTTGNLVEPPDWFSEDQKAGWRYAIEHAPLGLLKQIDRGALQVWVVAEDMHRQAAIAQQKLGLVMRMQGSGAFVQSPYLAIINRQGLIMLRAASELGFSPVSRPRVGRELQDPSPPEGAKRASTATVPLDEFLRAHPTAPQIH